jgi:hypothetical protein
MGALGLKEDSKPATGEMPVSLNKLAELTGFPVDFIKRELLLSDDSTLSVEELREKVLGYLDSNF